jgi:hypothetical protein
LRHYPTGEFENWDAVLDGLVKRGYNAIRFDVFPALVAPDSEGRVIQEHHFPKSDWKPTMWGGQYSTTIQPRRALKEFIPRCLDRGVLLGLSTWFFGSGVERVEAVDGFVRVWDETRIKATSAGSSSNIPARGRATTAALIGIGAPNCGIPYPGFPGIERLVPTELRTRLPI